MCLKKCQYYKVLTVLTVLCLKKCQYYKMLTVLTVLCLCLSARAYDYGLHNVAPGELPPPLRNEIVNANLMVIGGSGTAGAVIVSEAIKTGCLKVIAFDRGERIDYTTPAYTNPFYVGNEYSEGGYYYNDNQEAIRIDPNYQISNENGARGNIQTTVYGGNQRLSHSAPEPGEASIHDAAMCAPLGSPQRWCSPFLWGHAFNKLFTFVGPDMTPNHNGQGPIRFQQSRASNFQNEWVKSCTRHTGFPYQPDFNVVGGSMNVCGAEHSNIKTDGSRSNSETEMLNNYLNSTNLILIRGVSIIRYIYARDCGARVKSAKPRVVGVEGTFHGIYFKVRLPDSVTPVNNPNCPRRQLLRDYTKVIDAAGTIGTAANLLRSGIGPADELTRIGVKVRVNSTHVGRHYKEGLVSYFAYGTNATADDIGLFASNPDKLTSRPAMFRRAADGSTSMILVTPSLYNGAVSVYLLAFQMEQPNDFGRVRLWSPDPSRHPRVTQPWDESTTQQQVDTLLYGRSILANNSAGYSMWDRFQMFEWYPGGYPYDFPSIADSISKGSEPILHASGTARMSLTQADGVVDTRLNVHGVDDLMVAGNSIYRYYFGAGGQVWAWISGWNAASFIRQDIGLTPL